MRIALLTAAAAAALLAGCGGASERETASRERIERKERERDRQREEREREPVEAEAKAPPLEPAMQPASTVEADPAAVSRAWFAGRWTDTGDCGNAGLFSPDGTFTLADGTRGMWNVRQGRLVLQGTGGRSELALRRVGDDMVEVVNADGSVGRSTRC